MSIIMSLLRLPLLRKVSIILRVDRKGTSCLSILRSIGESLLVERRYLFKAIR